MTSPAETTLQFGTGRFLRAFADYFVHQAALEGQNPGKIVIVQSTGDDTAKLINAQNGRYHVLVRGLEDGRVIDQAEEITSVSRALSASHEWDEVKRMVVSKEIKFILSNTTEAGYQLDSADSPSDQPPKSFPAKLLLLLKHRFDAGKTGLTMIPCELMEGNADLLLKELLGLANKWKFPEDFLNWLKTECVWLHTLVDRIVTGPPQDHPLLEKDKLLIVAEPFAFWALEDKSKAARFITHKAITRTSDVRPYFLRKVRILNAAHTALLIKAKPRGFLIVREAVNDPELGAWLNRLLFEEIVPTLGGRVDQGELFAKQTIERFKNPFLEHKFSDIALHHESKMRIRLIPTQTEYEAKFGKKPPLLSEVIAEGLAGSESS
jgi:tagaturonate reductase